MTASSQSHLKRTVHTASEKIFGKDHIYLKRKSLILVLNAIIQEKIGFVWNQVAELLLVLDTKKVTWQINTMLKIQTTLLFWVSQIFHTGATNVIRTSNIQCSIMFLFSTLKSSQRILIMQLHSKQSRTSSDKVLKKVRKKSRNRKKINRRKKTSQKTFRNYRLAKVMKVSSAAIRILFKD